MHLYLVRHAEATPRGGKGKRPLTHRGKDQARRLASFLRPLKLRPTAIWHSGKLRALQTAELLEPAVYSRKGLIERDGLAPGDPVRPIARELAATRTDVMLVGHLPLLDRLVSVLLGLKASAQPLDFAKAAIVCIERKPDGNWQMQWMLIPELLPRK